MPAKNWCECLLTRFQRTQPRAGLRLILQVSRAQLHCRWRFLRRELAELERAGLEIHLRCFRQGDTRGRRLPRVRQLPRAWAEEIRIAEMQFELRWPAFPRGACLIAQPNTLRRRRRTIRR